MSQFTKILVVSPLGDGIFWMLQESMSYDVGSEGSGNTVNVPGGFITDFASVPRPLWWLFPKWGRYGNAAVIHDFLYWDQSRSRKEADDIFSEGMIVLGVRSTTRKALYWAVRLFGVFAWRKYRRLRRLGRIRVALIAPEKSVETGASLGA